MYEVPIPPAIGLKLVPKLAEIDLGLTVRRHGSFEGGGSLLVALGKALVHLPALRAVESVHYLSSVTAIVPVYPVRAGGVSLPPARQIVPLRVYPDIQGCSTVLLVACWDLDAFGLIVALPRCWCSLPRRLDGLSRRLEYRRVTGRVADRVRR